MIMKTQFPRTAVGKPETQESQWCSFSPRSASSRPKKSSCSSSNLKARTKLMSQLEGSPAEVPSHSGFLFYSSLPLVGRGPPILGKAIYLTNSNINLFHNHSESCQSNIWPSQVDIIKVTITIVRL